MENLSFVSICLGMMVSIIVWKMKTGEGIE